MICNTKTTNLKSDASPLLVQFNYLGCDIIFVAPHGLLYTIHDVVLNTPSLGNRISLDLTSQFNAIETQPSV